MPEDLDGALLRCAPCCSTPTRSCARWRPASGASSRPGWRRVELRPVDLKDGPAPAGGHVRRPAGRRTTNQAYGDAAAAEVDALLARAVRQLARADHRPRPCSCGSPRRALAQLHRAAATAEQTPATTARRRTSSTRATRCSGARRGRRQAPPGRRVPARAAGRRRRRRADLPADRPLRVVDLGCGNAYLSFAAYRFLAEGRRRRGSPVSTSDRRCASATVRSPHSSAGRARCSFVAGAIVDASDDLGEVDVVLALHACDTATDDALAQAVHWHATVVLASPCCHHDLQRQMSAGSAPAPYGLVARHAILRERLGDVLTDAVRAALLRRVGYQVEVVQFVSAEYTPRNTMIRAVRQHGAPAARRRRGVRRAGRRLGRDAAPADAARRRPCRPRLARSSRPRGFLLAAAPGPVVVLAFQDPAIDESSGLAASARHAGPGVDAQRRRRRRAGVRHRPATARRSRP